LKYLLHLAPFYTFMLNQYGCRAVTACHSREAHCAPAIIVMHSSIPDIPQTAPQSLDGVA
jgi:hypothetical protein